MQQIMCSKMNTNKLLFCVINSEQNNKFACNTNFVSICAMLNLFCHTFMFYLPNKVTTQAIFCTINNVILGTELQPQEALINKRGKSLFCFVFFVFFFLDLCLRKQLNKQIIKSKPCFQIVTSAAQDIRYFYKSLTICTVH